MTDPTLVRMSASSIGCTSSPTDAVEVTLSTPTSLRYDSVAGAFIYNWKTPSTAGQCLRVTASSGGGSIAADFKLV